MTNVKLNSHHSPYVLSLSFKGVNGETLVHMMEDKDILISRGSACSSKKSGNRILESMGLTNEEILGSVRISFSKLNTIEECAFAGKALNQCYKEKYQVFYLLLLVDQDFLKHLQQHYVGFLMVLKQFRYIYQKPIFS